MLISSHQPLALALAGIAVLLSGCATSPELPDAYQPPAAGAVGQLALIDTGTGAVPASLAPVAYLKGSRISDGGLFGSDYTGFVAMIDLKPVQDAMAKWSEPIALTPGKHTIVGEYSYSNFMARAYLPLDAKAGVTYQLMIKNGHEETAEARPYCDFWIVDQGTGISVTQVYRRQVSGGKRGTLFRANQ